VPIFLPVGISYNSKSFRIVASLPSIPKKATLPNLNVGNDSLQLPFSYKTLF